MHDPLLFVCFLVRLRDMPPLSPLHSRFSSQSHLVCFSQLSHLYNHRPGTTRKHEHYQIPACEAASQQFLLLAKKVCPPPTLDILAKRGMQCFQVGSGGVFILINTIYKWAHAGICLYFGLSFYTATLIMFFQQSWVN